MAKSSACVMGGAPGEWAHCTGCGQGLKLGAESQPFEVAIGAMKGFEKSHKRCTYGTFLEPDPATLAEWARSRDVGISAATIYSATTGNPTPMVMHGIPHDPSDFGRCYRFLKRFPELRRRLHLVAQMHPATAWPGLVAAWDELTALYEEELPSGKCPKLYARLQQIKEAARG